MWPHVEYEECLWERGDSDYALIPKSRRRKITNTYSAAVPATIANVQVNLPHEVLLRMSELQANIVRFDQEQKAKNFSLPALLLRSESSSSSQIERLTSSVCNVALAELSPMTPSNAQLIAGNVAAMRAAISQTGPINTHCLCAIHDTLMEKTDEDLGFRAEQVWIGGTAYSPSYFSRASSQYRFVHERT